MTTILLRTLRRGRVFTYQDQKYRVVDKTECGVYVQCIQPRLVNIKGHTFRARRGREQVWALNAPVQVKERAGAQEVS